MEPFYAFSISIVTNHFHTFNSTLQHFKRPQWQYVKPVLELQTISVPKNYFASALSAKFHSSTPPIGSPAPRRCICQTLEPPTCAAPVPYSLRRRYRGSPRWRAILHVDDAWAEETCNRCHPMRLDPRPFVPEQEWEWERPQGSCWPESRARHTDCLTGGFKRQNKPCTKLYSTIFLPWHF